MTWHIIEGEAGCAFAVGHGCVAVVVDALRASATAAMLLDAGATEILAVRAVDEALALRQEHPDALLFGERGGLPPEGFDYGNSPRDAQAARGRRIIFTTTTGAGRLVQCWGAPAVYMGTMVNATALCRAAARHGRDVVVIPAGLMGDPVFDAQEDWVAAACIARKSGAPLGEGAAAAKDWLRRIADEGIATLFASAPHASKLRMVGLQDDIAYCGQVDLTRAVPQGVARLGPAVRVVNAGG